MVTMLGMNGKRLRFWHPVQIQSIPRIKGILGRIVADLQTRRRVFFNDKTLDRQSFFSLAILWLQKMDIEELERGLSEQIDELIEAMEAEPDPKDVPEDLVDRVETEDTTPKGENTEGKKPKNSRSRRFK